MALYLMVERTDSISILGAAVTGGTWISAKSVVVSADTITFGGVFGVTGGETVNFTGTINAGAGADGIVFSGNNTYSGNAGFQGGGALGSAGFVIGVAIPLLVASVFVQ